MYAASLLRRRNLGYEEVLADLAKKGIAIRVASPKLVMEEVCLSGGGCVCLGVGGQYEMDVLGVSVWGGCDGCVSLGWVCPGWYVCKVTFAVVVL